jgi:hypothetical protein
VLDIDHFQEVTKILEAVLELPELMSEAFRWWLDAFSPRPACSAIQPARRQCIFAISEDEGVRLLLLSPDIEGRS